jgi:flagellar hook-associated protein 2
MTSISFGNFSQVDGKNVLTGGQSGIDTEGLIDALSLAKRFPAVALETQITTNLSKISALSSLDTKLQNLGNSLNKLRSPGGFSNSNNDVFASRLAFQTASDGSSAGNYFGIVAKNGAAIKSYEVEVLNLAVAETRRSGIFTSVTTSVVNASGDETSGFLSAGTFQINGVNITLNEGDNLTNIVAKINSKKGDTNVEASILKINDNQHRFVLSSTKTGTDNAITITDATDNVFVGGNEANIFITKVNAENASISIDGDTIQRQSNVFSDAVAGVTFSLFQETNNLPNAPKVKLDIGKDTAKISEAIVGFVDAYNDLRVFYGEQKARDTNGNLLETAVLSGNTLLETISNSIISALTKTVGIANPLASASTAAPKTLTDLGITFNDFDGDETQKIAATTSILELDAAILSDKIESNFEEVQKIFGFALSSSSSSLNLFQRGTISPSETYTIAIDATQASGFQASITHIDGKALAAPFYLDYDTSDPNYTATITGTGAFAGLNFLYNGDGTSTESVNAIIDNGEKDYTLAVNTVAATAKVTHIRGLELASAVDLTYTASATGGTITSSSESVLGEFTFLYSGSGSENIDISFTQGFADKLYNYVNRLNTGGSDSVQGAIDKEIQNLRTTNDSIQESVDRIDIQVNLFTEQLLIKFAALEAAIAASNSILDLLEAQTNAQNNQ